MPLYDGTCPVCKIAMDDENPMAHVDWCILDEHMMHKGCRFHYLMLHAFKAYDADREEAEVSLHSIARNVDLLLARHVAITRRCVFVSFRDWCDWPMCVPVHVPDATLVVPSWHRFVKTFAQRPVYRKLALRTLDAAHMFDHRVFFRVFDGACPRDVSRIVFREFLASLVGPMVSKIANRTARWTTQQLIEISRTFTTSLAQQARMAVLA